MSVVARFKEKIRERRTWLGISLQLAMWGCGWLTVQIARGFYLRKLFLDFARSEETLIGLFNDDFLKALGHSTEEEAAWQSYLMFNKRISMLMVHPLGLK